MRKKYIIQWFYCSNNTEEMVIDKRKTLENSMVYTITSIDWKYEYKYGEFDYNTDYIIQWKEITLLILNLMLKYHISWKTVVN